jgi:hypothetical protein
MVEAKNQIGKSKGAPGFKQNLNQTYHTKKEKGLPTEGKE